MPWNISVKQIYIRVNCKEILLTCVIKIGKNTEFTKDTQGFISSFPSSKECLKIGIVVTASKLLVFTMEYLKRTAQ